MNNFPHKSNKTISESEKTFKYKMVGKLGGSGTPVFLIQSPDSGAQYAWKVFPYVDGQPSIKYKLESRISQLSHPNIVKVLKTQDKQRMQHKAKDFCASFIIMERCVYGDLSHLRNNTTLFEDERLVRTYFHQLIRGFEYLHSQGIAHLDLKPDNLMLSKDYQLKIIDFDRCYGLDDEGIYSVGTMNYRAPELKNGRCKHPGAADIYAAGITLFVLLTGNFPYVEDAPSGRFNLYQLMQDENSEFWDVHETITTAKFSPEFKSLFFSMVKYDPVERATLQEVKKSKWYNGTTYTQSEIVEKLSRVIQEFKVGSD